MENYSIREKDGSTWQLNQKIFGPLWPYIIDKNVTDVDWDGKALWIESVDGKSKRIDNAEVNETFVINFTEHISNHSNSKFNAAYPVMETETETLRITCGHEDFFQSGRCFAIRKSLPELRYTALDAVENKFCEEKILHLVANCMKAGLSSVVFGEPSAGKTEFAKFISSFIKEEENVITIEDTKEWHYSKINPGKRCIEIKVQIDEENKTEMFEEYTKALKTALRLNPKWIMLSETRSKEVLYLIEALSNGVSGITTMHTNDVRNLEERTVSMLGNLAEIDVITNILYTFMNAGILVQKVFDEHGNKTRKITQFCFYYRENDENKCAMILENGQLDMDAIPETILRKFKDKGIEEPFYSEELSKRMQENFENRIVEQEVADEIV